MMKYRLLPILLTTGILLLTACGDSNSSSESTNSSSWSSTAEQSEEETQHATAAQQKVGFEGMEPVLGDSLKDGEYEISVDSSSSMFKIKKCILNVVNGELTAKMYMGGTGYEYLFMGTEEQASAADESSYIKYTDENGTYAFTVPVESLNKEIECAAFSKKKQEWYGRTLVFRGDSLPSDAYDGKTVKTAADLELADGEYTVNVTLTGGSGKASVQSPAKLTVTDKNAVAEIIWSSNKYDYMMVDGEKFLPTSIEEYSVFEIPVTGFDYEMPVSADTTAMSTPHEIEYTLNFDSSTIK